MYFDIFDAHAHYDDDAFDLDRDELLASMESKGVCGIINCGTTAENSKKSIALADEYPFIYCACGIHPNDADSIREGDFDIISELLKHPKCVAVGEIGLDYHYDTIPRERQIDIFERQLQIAVSLNLPVIVHDRDAHGDTLDLLKKYRPNGVVHCFSGSVEMAKEVLSLGMYIGLGGATTFKNAKKPLEVALCVSSDRLLLETDCPYMTPVPHRGKRNDSSFIPFSAEKIAEVRNCDTQTLITQCKENTCRLFGIS